MTLWAVHTDRGVGLRAARNYDTAYRKVCREVGDDNVIEVREATQADIDWVRGFGGYVPEGELEV